MGDKLNTAIATGALLVSLAGPVGAETSGKTAEIQDIKSDTQSKMQLLLKECDVDGNSTINGKEVKCELKYNIRGSQENIAKSQENITKSQKNIAESEQSIERSEKQSEEYRKETEAAKKRIEQLKEEIQAKVS